MRHEEMEENRLGRKAEERKQWTQQEGQTRAVGRDGEEASNKQWELTSSGKVKRKARRQKVAGWQGDWAKCAFWGRCR